MLNFLYARTGHAKNAKNVQGIPFPRDGVLCLTTFSNVHDSKLEVEQVHFHAQSIKVSPETIACKMAKLFAFSVINST